MLKYGGKQNFSFLSGLKAMSREKRERAKVNDNNGQYICLNQFQDKTLLSDMYSIVLITFLKINFVTLKSTIHSKWSFNHNLW